VSRRSLFALALLVACTSGTSAQAVLTGFVRADSTLQPLRDVEVLVDPHDATVDLVEGTQERVFYLKRTPTQLDTIAVAATRPRGIGREAFGEGRKLGLGKFIDSTELLMNEHKKLQDLLRQTGVRIVTPPRCDRGNGLLEPYCEVEPGSKRVAVSAATSFECPMQVVLDGVTLYRHRGQGALTLNRRNTEWATTFDLSSLMVSGIESVEIYRRTAEVPIEFGGSSAACGVLVLWTRRK